MIIDLSPSHEDEVFSVDGEYKKRMAEELICQANFLKLGLTTGCTFTGMKGAHIKYDVAKEIITLIESKLKKARTLCKNPINYC